MSSLNIAIFISFLFFYSCTITHLIITHASFSKRIEQQEERITKLEKDRDIPF